MKDLGKIVVTIECRMTSSRLPGKVLKEICGKPVLELMIERVQRVVGIDEIILATTTNKTDDVIEELARRMKIQCFRGSESNVLVRVADAALSRSADTVLCLTGDCPFADWNILSQLIDLYRYNDSDRAECNPPGKSIYPDGLGAHIVSMKDLLVAKEQASTKDELEHVVIFFRKHPEKFKCIYLPSQPLLHRPEIHITLDEPEDFELIKKIYEHFYFENSMFRSEDIIAFLDSHSDLLKWVKDVKRTDVKKLN